MRRLFVAILLILLCSAAVYADGYQVLGTATKVISAYKTKWNGNLPAPTIELRLLDYNNSEIESRSDLTMSINTRNQAFEAFSWVLGGNLYNGISVKFTFGPMYWEADSSSTEIIPYSIKLEHESSRIGNTPIPTGPASSAARSPITNEFTPYSFYYADAVTGSGDTINVGADGQSKTKTLVYNMSTNTVVKNGNGNTVTYNEDVCNYWNRTGKATVTLKITAAGQKVNTTTNYMAGTYYAAVQVEVWIQ